MKNHGHFLGGPGAMYVSTRLEIDLAVLQTQLHHAQVWCFPPTDLVGFSEMFGGFSPLDWKSVKLPK